MSSVTIDFTYKFSDEDSANHFDRGLRLIADGAVGEAHFHFGSHADGLGIEESGTSWSLEEYDRNGLYLSGFVAGGTISFDTDTFLDTAAQLGVSDMLASLFNDQVGEGATVAKINGKTTSASKVLKKFSDDNLNFALGIAVEKEKTKNAIELLEKGADPNAVYSGSAVLATAISKGASKVANALLDAGADPNGALRTEPGNAYPKGDTALCCAVEEGNRKLVKRLLDAGADPNLPDGFGTTPLHIAVRDEELYDLAGLLIESGSKVNGLRDDSGLSPFLAFLEFASDHSLAGDDEPDDAELAMELFDELLEHGVSVEETGANGGNAAWYSGGHLPLRKKIAELGCSVVVPPEGTYPVGETAENLYKAIVFTDSEGFAREMAGFSKLTQEQKDKCLFKAVSYNRLDFAKALVEAGADPSSRPEMDMPIYRFAKERLGNAPFAEYLKEKSKEGIARDRDKVRPALDAYRRFEQWYAGLADSGQEMAEGEPFYTLGYLHHIVKYRSSRDFNIIKDLVTKPIGGPAADFVGKRGDFVITRKFLHGGEERECKITMNAKCEIYEIKGVKGFRVK